MNETPCEPVETRVQTLRVSVDQELCVPPEVGFRYLTTMENWSEFLPGFVRFVGPGRWQEPGDRSTVVVRSLGVDGRLEMELLEFEPGQRVRFLMRRTGIPELHHERIFSPTQAGCRCAFTVTYRPRRGWLGLLDTAALPRVLLAGLRAAAAACRANLRAPALSRL